MEDDAGDGLFLMIRVKKKCYWGYLLLLVTRGWVCFEQIRRMVGIIKKLSIVGVNFRQRVIVGINFSKFSLSII